MPVLTCAIWITQQRLCPYKIFDSQGNFFGGSRFRVRWKSKPFCFASCSQAKTFQNPSMRCPTGRCGSCGCSSTCNHAATRCRCAQHIEFYDTASCSAKFTHDGKPTNGCKSPSGNIYAMYGNMLCHALEFPIT